jgi:hypothetical protein
MESHLIPVLSLGFFLGLKHATDADHVLAVTTFVSKQRSVLSSCWIGVFWGLGHTLALALAGLIVIGLKVNVSHVWESRLEFLVAAMLVVLGIRVLLKQHAPPHFHSPDLKPHSHFGWTQLGFRPFVVGIVHGAAGSAALMLLVLSAIRNPLEAVAYIGVFGSGSIIGMLIVSLLLSLPVHWAATHLAKGYRHLQIAAGLLSCSFGFVLGYEVWLRG